MSSSTELKNRANVYLNEVKAAFIPGQHVAGNMLPATKLLPVCWPSVAGYIGIHDAEIQATCCRATCCPGVNAA